MFKKEIPAQNPFRLLLYTPFKTGSSSLSLMLEHGFGIKRIWHHFPDRIHRQYLRQKSFVLRGHTLPLDDVLKVKRIRFDSWVTIIRRPYEIYPSCFFQDIASRDYPYFFGSRRKVLNADPDEITEHFLAFDWESWPASDYDYNFQQIKNYSGIDLWKENFDRTQGFHIHESRNAGFKYVGAIRIDKLRDPQTLSRFLFRLGLGRSQEAVLKRLVIKHGNRGDKKWYGKKYDEFVSALAPEYFNRFRQVNDRITGKFFEEHENTKNNTPDMEV